MAKLQNPLSQLGFPGVQPAQARCGSVIYNGLQNQVDCTVDVQVFSETAIKGKHALQVDYSLVDNSLLDMDPTLVKLQTPWA